MIRFIIAAIFVVSYLVLSIPLLLIELIIGLFAPKAKAKSSQAFICFGFRIVEKISGTTVIVKGLDNVVKDEPVLFVPNHRSIYDIILTYPRFKNQTGFVSKKEIKKTPIFNIWMMFMNCQFLDRKDLRKGLKTILRSADLVKNGTCMCIFPEGTRNRGNEPLQPFHDGSLKIAEKAGCRIVPVSINNTEKIFEAQFPKIRKTTVVIEYLPPVDISGLSRKEIQGVSLSVQESIKNAYIANQQLIESRS